MLAETNWRAFWEPSQMTQVLQGLVPLRKLGKLTPGLALMAFFPPLLSCIRSQRPISPSSSELPLKAPPNIFSSAANAYSQDKCASAHSLNFQLSTHSSLLVLARGDSSWLTVLGSRMRRAHGSGQECDLRAGERCKPLTSTVLLGWQSLHTSQTL